MEDAQMLLVGGSVMTSTALTPAKYYDLFTRPARPLPLVELEKRDHSTPTTYETLRISHGVTHRLQRVSPDPSLRY